MATLGIAALIVAFALIKDMQSILRAVNEVVKTQNELQAAKLLYHFVELHSSAMQLSSHFCFLTYSPYTEE